MTACIHHGPPGSFKSFGVLQDEVIPALLAGRTVVTNVRGLDSIEQVEIALDIEIPPEAQLISVPHTNEGYKSMAVWFHWVPRGALIFMDEGQRVYPTRLKSLAEFDYVGGPDQAEIDGRPFSLENAFDQHRHHNWDIYITTPNIAKIHKEIRQSSEYAFRHRNLTGVLPWYNNKWKEVRHDPSTSGQSASSCIGQPIVKKADKRYFACYQSTETGKATNDIKNPAIFKQPKVIFFALILFCSLGYQGWFWFGGDDSSPSLDVVSQAVASDVSSPSPAVSSGGDGLNRVNNNAAYIRPAIAVNYLDHPVMHQRGQFLGTLDNRHKRNHIFRFYDEEGRFYQITSNDLKQLGFTVSAVGCVSQIGFKGRYRFIHCYDQLAPELSSEDSQSQNHVLSEQSRIDWLETQEVVNQF